MSVPKIVIGVCYTLKTIEGFAIEGGIGVSDKNFRTDHRDLGDHWDWSEPKKTTVGIEGSEKKNDNRDHWDKGDSFFFLLKH